MEDEGEIVELFGQDTLFGWLIIRAVRRIQKKGFSIDLCLLPIEENWSNKFDHVSESITFLTAAGFPFFCGIETLAKEITSSLFSISKGALLLCKSACWCVQGRSNKQHQT